MSAPTPSQIALAKKVEGLYGPSIIGLLLAMVLFGVSATQLHIYFSKFGRTDRKWIRILVSAGFIFDTVVTILDIIFIYMSLVKHFGFESTADGAGIEFAIDRGFTGLVGTIVQVFFAWRIFVLTKSKFIGIAIIILALISFGGSIGVAYILVGLPFAHYGAFTIEAIIWLIASAVCDITISTVLMWYLRSHKTGFQRTDDIIDKLVRLTMQTGLITTIWALMDLVGYLVWGEKNGVHITFQTMLSKLYINSLLSSLNARSAIDESMDNSRSRDRNEVISLPAITRTQVFVSVDREEDVGGIKQTESRETFPHDVKEMA